MRLWHSIPLTLFLGVVGVLVGSPTTTTASAASYTYDAPAFARFDAHASGLAEAGRGTRVGLREGSASPSAEGLGASTTSNARIIATEAAGTRIPWNSYADYPKVTINGREYANVGGRPYTQHAVDRLQPSGLGAPAGASGPGRSIAPGYVDDVLTGSQTVRKPVVGPNGEARVSHVSGSVEVITEGDIVITVITR